MQEGKAVFPKAELFIHEVEAAFWLDRALQPGDPERIVGNSNKQRATTRAVQGRIRRIKDGEVLPGITAMLRPGHTPGHTNWLIQSGGERILIWGDIVHLAAVQLARPEARLIYDVDSDMAAATRQRVLDWVGERAARRRRRPSGLSGLWRREAQRGSLRHRGGLSSKLAKAPPPSASPLSRTAAASAPPSRPACWPA